MLPYWSSRGITFRESGSLPKGHGFESLAGSNCRWEEWMNSALSTFNTTTELPFSKAPNPQLLPGRRNPLLRVCVHGVCVFTTVCVHLNGINAEHKFWVWIPILGHTSCHFCFNLFDDWLLYWWCTQINTIYNNNNNDNSLLTGFTK